MKQQILLPGHGKSYAWSNDHVQVKASLDLTDGRLTLVEDTLKSGFALPRHFHKKMTEIFYILDGSVEFAFDNELVQATPGVVINVPSKVWHSVKSPQGARLLTIFSPGGFDQYLEELVTLTESQYGDAALMRGLAERYDIFEA
jgi:quercetin dioxygenase-like cupin family protein